MSEDKIEIPLEQYNQLLKDQKTLRALQAGGVDNWEGHWESLKEAGLLEKEESDD